MFYIHKKYILSKIKTHEFLINIIIESGPRTLIKQPTSIEQMVGLRIGEMERDALLSMEL